MSVRVTLGNMKFTAKPTGNAVGALQSELKRIGTSEISMLELLYAVGQGGRSFKPAIYKEDSDLHADDFVQTEIIGIDIDAKNTKKGDLSWYKIENTLEILRKYELDYIGIYKSFSYSEEEQCHRILFQLPAPICNDNMYYFVNMLFNELFPADEACFDKARMFYGGKGVIEGSNKPLNLGNLFYAVMNKMRKNDAKNFSRTVEAFCTKANLNMVNGLPDVDITGLGEYIQNLRNDGSLYNITIDNATTPHFSAVQILVPHFTADIVIQSTKKGNKESKATTKVAKGNKPEKFNYSYGEERYSLDKLKDDCRLFEEVTLCGHWAYHEELKILVWNFHPIKGAMDALVNALLPHEKKDSSLNYRYRVGNLVSSALNREYEPKHCDYNCPFFADCKIIKQGYKAPYHYISANRIKPIEKIPANERLKVLSSVTSANGDLPPTEYETPLVRKPLDIVQQEASTVFIKSIKALYAGTDPELIVLKAPTGIGKTRMLIDTDWSQFAGKRVALAFPTHALKNEVALEFAKKGITVGIKPDKKMAVVRDARLKDRIDRLYEAGNRKASKLYHQYLNAHPEVPEYAQYLEDQAQFQSADIMLTTHADVLLNKTDRYDYLIVDEDILLTSCETQSAKKSDIESVVMYLKSKLDIQYRLVNDVLEFMANPAESMLQINRYDNYKKLCDQYQKQIEGIMTEQPELDVNVLKILTADYAMKSVSLSGVEYIHFGKRRKLPSKPTLIMSATVFEDVYTYAYRYEKKIQFFSIDYVGNCGILEQDLTYSFSKGNLNTNTDRNIDYIKECIEAKGKKPEDYTVITFKDSKSIFKDAGFNVAEDVHFGNTAGYNTLTGQNILVIGTYHIPSTDLKMYSLLLFDVILPESEFIEAEMEDKKRYDINGIRLLFPSFDNPYIRITQFYLLQSELVQAVGRARLIRNPEAKVLLFSNFPVEEADCYYHNAERLF